MAFDYTVRDCSQEASHTVSGEISIESSQKAPLTPSLVDRTEVPTPEMAFGLRLLRVAYTGKALKVRRTSDDVEADVAFNSSGLVVATSAVTVTSGSYSGVMTLEALCAGTNGQVVTWYDQSGNGRNLIMASAAAQPAIVTAGELLDTLDFDGGDYMETTFEFESSTDDYTYAAVVKTDASDGSAYGIMTDLKTFNDGSEVHIDATTLNYRYHIEATDLVLDLPARAHAKDLVIGSYDPARAANEQKLRINGKLFQQNCTENIAAGSREPFAIGVRRSNDGGYALSSHLRGNIYEVACWETALDGNEVAAVEDDLMSHHGITNPYSKWCVDFDGSNDYVALTETNLGTVYTMSAWFKLPDLNDAEYALMGGPANHYNFTLKIYNSGANHRWFHATYDATTAPYASSQDVDPAGGFTLGWHHYAISRNGTAVSFYIDGALVSPGVRTLPANFDGKVKYLGRYESVYTEGNLDEVAIFDRALTETQINEIYNGGAPATIASLSPVGWWRMGDNISGPLRQTEGTIASAVVDMANPTLGSELITGFVNGTTTPYDTFTSSGRDITSAIESSGGGGGCASDNSFAVTAGEVYEVNFDLTYNSGTDTLRVTIVGGQSGTHGETGSFYTETTGTNKGYLVSGITDGTAHLQLSTWAEAAQLINFSATDVSLKKLNGNHGTLTNGPVYSPAAAPEISYFSYGSIDFDGTNDRLDCGTALGDALGDNYAGSLSVSLWFKADVADHQDGIFALREEGNHGKFQFSMWEEEIQFQCNGTSWKREVAFTDTASWHHLVCIYAAGSESDSKMYLDGVAVGSTSGSFPVAADMDFAGLNTIIGGFVNDSYLFNGKIDEVGIWDSALTAADVLFIYNDGLPADLSGLNPLDWYRMGEFSDTSGTTIYSIGSARNAGTLINGPLFSADTPT